jgi:hypothetical protein
MTGVVELRLKQCVLRLGYGGAIMSSMVMIRCPVTDETVASGLLMARDAFRVLRTKNSDIRCPACGELHSWQDVTAWLARVRYPEGGKSTKQGRRSSSGGLSR